MPDRTIRTHCALVLAAAALLARAPLGSTADPVISEFMADNRESLLDEDGDSSDWLEVHNPGPDAVDLLGWSLTDDAADPGRWDFPARSLEPGGYLIVFASGKDRTPVDGELHTNFRLDAAGEYLALIAPDGSASSEFAPRFAPQREDVSFGVGKKTVGAPLVAEGGTARFIVPADGSRGLTWTGDPADEPFDDSASAGWLAATSGVGYAQAEASDTPSQPLAYWSFDRNVADSTGNGHDGSLEGGPTFSADAPALLGGGESIRFGGAGEYVSATIDVSETSYTSSLWFKTTDASGGLFVVVDRDLGAGGHDRHLYLTGGNLATRVWNNQTIVSSGRNFADGVWHHLAHVVGVEIGGQRVYVDGELVASGTKAISDFDWQRRVNIGFSNDAPGQFFNGWIDDVSIWDSVLSEQAIGALAAGASPLALGGVAPCVTTDVSAQMRGVNASAYVRIPFTAGPEAASRDLELRVKYDDGFVAYLNGVEVARRNAPDTVTFDSAAPLDRPEGQAIRQQSIDLTSYRGVLRNGANVLAIHALNDAVDSEDFLMAPTLVSVEVVRDRFLSPPSPGAANGPGAVDFVADTKFSLDRGFYSAPFDVAIASATEGAAIYYTTDGSDPGAANPNATFYTEPIRIDTTTTLRAAAFKEDFHPTNADTQTYLFPADVAAQPAAPPGLPATWSGNFPADYEVDAEVIDSALPGYSFAEALVAVPSVSVTTDPDNLFREAQGIYFHSLNRGSAWERPASVELIFPDGRRGFQIDCGIRIHGNSSRRHSFTPKHQIRLVFKSQFGPRKLEYPVFDDSEVDRFDQLLLRGSSTDSWPVVNGGSVLGVQRWNRVQATYMRDQWMRDAQNAMGRPSAHGRYVQLYLNGLYWGMYNLAERPTDSFNAEHFGGEREEYDVVKDFAELQSGNKSAWNAMISLAGAGLASDEAYQRIQGNNPDGSRNPDYPRYLDVDNLTDYMILHISSGAEDWPDHNWWAGRRRGPESDGYKFFVWDQEISNDSLVRTHTRIQTRFEDPISSASPSFLYGRLMENATFRQRFIDRVHALLFNGGLLSPDANSARWLARQGETDQAIVGESARWGDSKKAVPYKREVEWLAEMNWMRDTYWIDNHPIAVQRFRNVGLYPELDAPIVRIDGQAQHGGRIVRGAELSLTVETVAVFDERVLVDGDAPVSALVPSDGRLGVSWRLAGFAEGALGESWLAGGNGVGYENGTGYAGAIRVDVGAAMTGAAGNPSVYVRIPFTVADQATLDALDALELQIAYDDGFAAYLNGVRVASANAPDESTIAWNAASTGANEASLTALSRFDLTEHRSRLVVGDNLLALHGLNFNTTSSDMIVLARLVGQVARPLPSAPSIVYTTDGSDPKDPGASTFAAPIELVDTTRVKARAYDGAEWSALTEALFAVEGALPLRVTELMYHPRGEPPGLSTPFSSEDYEFVEIQNTGNAAVSLEGVRIRGGIDFDFSESDVARLDPGAYVLVVGNREAFVDRYGEGAEAARIAGEYERRLDNAGESISLEGPLGEALLSFDYSDDWYPATDGFGYSLVATDARAAPELWSQKSGWRPSRFIGGSPGGPDGAADPGGRQLPGDANQDARLDLGDVLALLLHLFAVSPPSLPCDGAAVGEGGNHLLLDYNSDALVDAQDAVSLVGHLFGGAPAPARGDECLRIEGCPDVCEP